MISVYVQQNGETTCTDRVKPEWLDPASKTTIWVDLAAPSPEDNQVLDDVFHFHQLAIEDARSALQYPKVEPYDGYLYLILHGISLKPGEHEFGTRDIDFFLGRNYLVTVHDGASTSIKDLQTLCARHQHILAEGPVGLLHRIVDSMVDSYRPVAEELEDRIDRLEEEAFAGRDQVVRDILQLKRTLGTMRRILIPQRDAIGRLARREFSAISDEMAYRFRDVYDHVVRLTEEVQLFQERVTSILEVNLATVSNRLNVVMKVLTVMSTIFLPLTVLTGMWGMNIPLPMFPGPADVQFWWVAGVMLVIIAGMLLVFRRKGWI